MVFLARSPMKPCRAGVATSIVQFWRPRLDFLGRTEDSGKLFKLPEILDQRSFLDYAFARLQSSRGSVEKRERYVVCPKILGTSPAQCNGLSVVYLHLSASS